MTFIDVAKRKNYCGNEFCNGPGAAFNVCGLCYVKPLITEEPMCIIKKLAEEDRDRNALSAFSDQDLQKELKRRHDEEMARRKAIEEARCKRIADALEPAAHNKARDLFMALLPEHGRSSCGSDKEMLNVGRCKRCDLLQALELGEFARLSLDWT